MFGNTNIDSNRSNKTKYYFVGSFEDDKLNVLGLCVERVTDQVDVFQPAAHLKHEC
jgi:hypothetical protein